MESDCETVEDYYITPRPEMDTSSIRRRNVSESTDCSVDDAKSVIPEEHQYPVICLEKVTPMETDVTDLHHLNQMDQIIFLDLDVWPCFFHKLPDFLPHETFIWAFYSGAMNWIQPKHKAVFLKCKENKCFYLNEKSERANERVNADVQIKTIATEMNDVISKSIVFTIVGEETLFVDLKEVISDSGRQISVIDPNRSTVQQIYLAISHKHLMA